MFLYIYILNYCCQHRYSAVDSTQRFGIFRPYKQNTFRRLITARAFVRNVKFIFNYFWSLEIPFFNAIHFISCKNSVLKNLTCCSEFRRFDLCLKKRQVVWRCASCRLMASNQLKKKQQEIEMTLCLFKTFKMCSDLWLPLHGNNLSAFSLSTPFLCRKRSKNTNIVTGIPFSPL